MKTGRQAIRTEPALSPPGTEEPDNPLWEETIGNLQWFLEGSRRNTRRAHQLALDLEDLVNEAWEVLK